MDSKSEAAAQLGRLGGSKKTQRKSISSRENGKKGGRPPKSLRLTIFESFKEDPGQRTLFAKLTEADLEQCRAFIRDRSSLDRNDFAKEVNRWMLDQPKPKNYTAMWALVSQANSK